MICLFGSGSVGQKLPTGPAGVSRRTSDSAIRHSIKIAHSMCVHESHGTRSIVTPEGEVVDLPKLQRLATVEEAVERIMHTKPGGAKVGESIAKKIAKQVHSN